MLYLLHGIGGDEAEWIRFATPDALFDNLIADRVAVPMIVVIPNGRALADDSATGNQFAPEKVAGFARFEQDLLDNLIPAIEKKYAALAETSRQGAARPCPRRRPRLPRAGPPRGAARSGNDSQGQLGRAPDR